MAKNKGTLHTMDILGRREMKIRKWKQLFLVLLCAVMIITQIPIEALANSAQSSENTVMSEENQEDKQEIPIDKEQNHKQNPKAIQEEIVAAEETEKPKASEEDLEKNNPLEEELKDSGQPEEEQINPEEGKDSQPEEGEEKEGGGGKGGGGGGEGEGKRKRRGKALLFLFSFAIMIWASAGIILPFSPNNRMGGGAD